MCYLLGMMFEFLVYLEKYCLEVVFYDIDLDKVVVRWIYLNQMIEDFRFDVYFWWVEDGEGGLLEWLLEKGVVENVDLDQLYNNWEYNLYWYEVEVSVEWDDIYKDLKGLLVEMMEWYGYSLWQVCLCIFCEQWVLVW